VIEEEAKEGAVPGVSIPSREKVGTNKKSAFEELTLGLPRRKPGPKEHFKVGKRDEGRENPREKGKGRVRLAHKTVRKCQRAEKRTRCNS